MIRTFVFAWATEYVCFIVEIVSAFVFYYYWGRLPQKVHTIDRLDLRHLGLGEPGHHRRDHGLHARPGQLAGRPRLLERSSNRQALPQIISRTGGALLLSSLYVYLHAAITIKDPKLHALIESRSTRPALLGRGADHARRRAVVRLPAASAQAAMYAAPVLNVLMALLFAATGIVFVLLFLGPYRNPGWIKTPGFAASILLFGIIGMSTAEFIREAVRKPYICYNVVLGSQMLTDEVAAVREKGFLESGTWTKAFVRANYPQVMSAEAASIANACWRSARPTRSSWAA